jgi:hypothetical protein
MWVREAVSRAQSSTSAKRTLDDFVALYDMSFLVVPEPVVHAPRPRKRKRCHMAICPTLPDKWIQAESERKPKQKAARKVLKRKISKTMMTHSLHARSMHIST